MSVFGVFWSEFSRIWTKLPRISPYSVPMQENTNQKNSEYRYFWRSESVMILFRNWKGATLMLLKCSYVTFSTLAKPTFIFKKHIPTLTTIPTLTLYLFVNVFVKKVFFRLHFNPIWKKVWAASYQNFRPIPLIGQANV